MNNVVFYNWRMNTQLIMNEQSVKNRVAYMLFRNGILPISASLICRFVYSCHNPTLRSPVTLYIYMSFATYAAWNVRHECGERSETFIYGNYYVYIYTYLRISIYVYLSYLCICIFFRTVSSSNVYSRASTACFINFLSILPFQCTKKIDVLFPLDLDSPWCFLRLSFIFSSLSRKRLS